MVDCLNCMKIHSYYYSWQKRAFDIVFSVCLLLLTLPITVLICFLILLTSGWPIIFTQQRFGKDKKPFTLFKFRTMKNGAEKIRHKLLDLNEAPAPMFKIKNDPRFTAIGKWLSQSGVDELPQLINILMGKMSLVGPRPLPTTEASLLDPSWDFRYSVLPGSFSDWVIHDKKYISLAHWKDIEKKSLKKGSIIADIILFVQIFIHVGRQLYKNTK